MAETTDSVIDSSREETWDEAFSRTLTREEAAEEQSRRDCIVIYRAVAARQFDVHQWGSQNGKVYQEVSLPLETDVTDLPNWTEELSVLLGLEIVYLGTLSPELATELANSLEGESA